jgi:hypothetical protein
MGDEKDQNLPARPTSSLMGQLVRQRLASEVAPTKPESTGVAGQQQATGVGGGRTAAPPPGSSGMARPGGPSTGVGAGGAGKGGAGLPAADSGPTRADIERIDAKDDYGHYSSASSETSSPAGDLGAKFSANQQLIREREKLIIDGRHASSGPRQNQRNRQL